MTTPLIIEFFGWLGSLLLLLAYGLVSASKITPTQKLYHLLNLLGGCGIVIVSLDKEAYPPAALNVVWCLVAIAGLWNPRKI